MGDLREKNVISAQNNLQISLKNKIVRPLSRQMSPKKNENVNILNDTGDKKEQRLS